MVNKDPESKSSCQLESYSLTYHYLCFNNQVPRLRLSGLWEDGLPWLLKFIAHRLLPQFHSLTDDKGLQCPRNYTKHWELMDFTLPRLNSSKASLRKWYLKVITWGWERASLQDFQFLSSTYILSCCLTINNLLLNTLLFGFKDIPLWMLLLLSPLSLYSSFCMCIIPKLSSAHFLLHWRPHSILFIPKIFKPYTF